MGAPTSIEHPEDVVVLDLGEGLEDRRCREDSLHRFLHGGSLQLVGKAIIMNLAFRREVASA